MCVCAFNLQLVKKEAANLKMSREEYMGSLGGRKEKENVVIAS